LFRLNIDAKVYVGNVPTDDLTDGQLLEFFKPFGKISGSIFLFNFIKIIFILFEYRYSSI